MYWSVLLIYGLCGFTEFTVSDDSEQLYTFPDYFQFGASTSAYQTEGGWNADGKGLNVFDVVTHLDPGITADYTNGDQAAESYYFFDKDLEIIKYLGLQYYRFSISWARILPTGDVSSLNQAGVDYYNMVIDKLLANNVEPLVTIYHLDLPQDIQKLGGITNPIFVKYYVAYATLLFDLYGDRVKTWLTFNEPKIFCLGGYGIGDLAPAVSAHGVGEYLCGHQVLTAHTLAYKVYKEHYFKKFGGRVGITIQIIPTYKKVGDSYVLDERIMEYDFGWFANPIFSKQGDYPEVMRKEIDEDSKREGRLWSRLPHFTPEFVNMMRGSFDFLGLNFYAATGEKVNVNNANSSQADSGVVTFENPECSAKTPRKCFDKTGFRDALQWIKGRYGDIEIKITENGWPTSGPNSDTLRPEFIKSMLQEVLKAIYIDKVNVTTYTYWSLIDQYEFNSGYTIRFGLYDVVLSSPTKDRVRRPSASVYKEIIRNRRL